MQVRPDHTETMGRSPQSRGRREWRRASASMACFAVILATGLTGCGFPVDSDAGLLGNSKELEKARVAADADETQTHAAVLTANAEYEVFDLGPVDAGDEWTFLVSASTGNGRHLVLAVLDGDDCLLQRKQLSTNTFVRHTLRSGTDHLYAAVMSTVDEPVEFELVAAVKHDTPVPAPRTQVVWLNFDGASDVSINRKPGISFPAFDGAVLGSRYADQTEALKAEITRVVRETYEAYDVIILSSDEEPAPKGPHSTVHFGGDHDCRLGQADSVDRCNENLNDNAIVFVEGFESYRPMRLSTEEMARMIGNTAAHELGHLLGLFHTRGEQHLMDDSNTAWDLAGEANLDLAAVAPTVFPIGMEDSVAILAQTVGLRADVELAAIEE